MVDSVQREGDYLTTTSNTYELTNYGRLTIKSVGFLGKRREAGRRPLFTSNQPKLTITFCSSIQHNIQHMQRATTRSAPYYIALGNRDWDPDTAHFGMECEIGMIFCVGRWSVSVCALPYLYLAGNFHFFVITFCSLCADDPDYGVPYFRPFPTQRRSRSIYQATKGGGGWKRIPQEIGFTVFVCISSYGPHACHSWYWFINE